MAKCKRCNCDKHKNCHVDYVEMGFQGLMITGGKSTGFETHFPHKEAIESDTYTVM